MPAGYSAALMLGADCAPRNAPAEVLVPGHLQRLPMLRVRYGVPAADDVVEARGCRVTGPGRTAWDLTRGLPVTEAVVAVMQYRIADEYGFALARADLAYPDARLAIEYDGAAHFTAWAGKRDRRRDGVLAGYGWLTMRQTDDDLATMPQTVQRIAHQLRIRGNGRHGRPVGAS